jgi:hypothetical protein
MITKQTKQLGLPLIISVGTIVIILGSMLVLSGKFSSLVTTIIKPHASMSMPQIDGSFTDSFKSDAVNTDKWQVARSDEGKVIVAQTAANNLRIDITGGTSDKKVSEGGLVFKQALDDQGDFRALAVFYQPVVTDDRGGAVSGIRFASSDTSNGEAAVIRWIVRKDKEKKLNESVASFAVLNAKGDTIYSKELPLKSNIAVFRIVRVNKKYRAGFQVGNDMSSDTNVTWLTPDDFGNASLGQNGRITLFTNNNGMKDTFASVYGRVDTAVMQWQYPKGTPTPTPNGLESFNDAFSVEGTIDKKWTKRVPADGSAEVTANKANNLAFTFVSGPKANSASVVRNNPVVAKGKNFQMTTYIYQPKAVGQGGAYAGILFAEPNFVPAGASKVFWVVSADKTVNKLQFSMMGDDRNWHVKAEKDLNDTKPKAVTLMLRRLDGKYTAHFRLGDNDADWVKLGNDETLPFDATGNMVLFGGTTKGKDVFPYASVQFDQAGGYAQK